MITIYVNIVKRIVGSREILCGISRVDLESEESDLQTFHTTTYNTYNPNPTQTPTQTHPTPRSPFYLPKNHKHTPPITIDPPITTTLPTQLHQQCFIVQLTIITIIRDIIREIAIAKAIIRKRLRVFSLGYRYWEY
jgi:hypothetical protein